MNRYFRECIVFLVLLLCFVAYGTLSKSDRKDKSKKFQKLGQKQKEGSDVVKESEVTFLV